VSGVPPYPSVPVPSTYANDPVTTLQLRDDMTNGVSFLANRPNFGAYCTGTPLIPASAWTPVVLDTEQSDPWNGHAVLTGSVDVPQNYYCQAAGWYLGEGYVPWVYTGATNYAFSAGLGVSTAGGLTTYQGQQHITSAGLSPGVFAADLFQMTRTGVPGSSGSDYVQLQAWTNASGGADLDASTANYPRLSVRWAGTGNLSVLGVPANAAFPVPPVFVDNTWLNTNIRDTLKFLINPPMIRYTTPSVSALVATTWPAGTPITLTGETLDNQSAYSTSTGLFTAPAAGVYYIIAQVAVAVTSTASASHFAAGIAVNGGTTWGNAVYIPAGVTGTVIATATGRFRMSAGGTAGLVGFNDLASLTFQTPTKFIAVWESS
jgi:hypothetical protein